MKEKKHSEKASPQINQNRRPTSWDVAKLAGVGRTTVSRVINKPETVSPQSRAKVEKAMRTLGYRPSAVARGLVQGRQGVIGLISDVSKDSYHRMGVVDGIASRILSEDYWFGIASIEANTNVDELEKLPMIRQHTCDGFIFNTESVKGDIFDFCSRFSIPSVFVNLEKSNPADCVIADDEWAATQAVNHLIENGHTRIGYITVSQAGHKSSAESRERGYEMAMLRAGLKPVDEYNKKLPLDEPQCSLSIEELIKRWLAQQDPVTAILAYGPSITMKILRVAMLCKWQIPETFSFMACDDTPIFSQLPVPVTAMSLDRHEVGVKAADMLLKKIETGAMRIPSEFVRAHFSKRGSVNKIT